MSSAVSWINATYGIVGPTGPTGPSGSAGPTGATGPASPAQVAQFYKTANQSAGSGQNYVTWDATQPWSDTGLFSWTPGSSNITITTRGIYQIGLSVNNQANGATWSTLGKGLTLWITRSPYAAQATLNDNTSIASLTSYNQTTIGTVELFANDILQMSVGQTLASGNTLISGQGTGPDLNTSFSLTFLRATS